MHVHRLQKEKIEQFGGVWWIQKQKERLRAYAKQVLWWGVTVWMLAWLLVLMFLYVEDESVREAKPAPPPLAKEVTQTNLQPLEVRTKDGQTIVIPPNATWSPQHIETVREKPKEEVKSPTRSWKKR